MMRFVETVWLVFFLAGLLLLGIFGTWSETAPFWYGAGLIAVAGVGALLSSQGKPSEQIGWSGLAVMAVFACYFGWRAYTSEVRWLARQDLVFGGTALVAYGLMAVRFTTPRARLAVLAVLFLLVAGNAGVGLYQYFVNPRWTVFRLFDLKRAAEVSAGGFFESGNHHAGFMTLAGLPLLGVAVLGRGLNGLIRAAAAAGFLLAGTGVAFSTSRGGAAGFFAGMGLLIILCGMLGRGWPKREDRAPSKGMGRLLLALGFTFCGLLAGAGFVLKRMFGTGSLTSLTGRGPMWDAALEQWQTAPLIGNGARSYEYMERAFRTLDTQWNTWAGEIDAVFAHNDYLQCLGDYGIIGLALVILTVFWHFLSALRHTLRLIPFRNYQPRDGLATGLTAGATAALAGLMLQALVEFNLHIGINAVMTGILLGFLATPGFQSVPEPTAGKVGIAPAARPKTGASCYGRRLAACGVIAAVSLLILEHAWRLAPADFAWRQGRKQLKTATTLPELIAASGAFQRATTLDPENFEAWHMRGLVTLQTASLTADKYAHPFYEAALTQFEQSLQLNPYNPYAAAQAGSVAGYLSRLDVAEGHFVTALRWGQNIPSVLELYGDYLIRRKQYDKAIGYFAVGLQRIGNDETKANLSRKISYCVKKMRQQGLPPPPEAFIGPSSSLPEKP